MEAAQRLIGCSSGVDDVLFSSKLRAPFRISWLAALLLLVLAGCGGGGGTGGSQEPLQTCAPGEVVLDSGQCGPPPDVECEAPEIAVDGRCVVPDKPTPKYQPGPNEAVIYYNRRDKNFDGWVLHLWNNGCEAGSWDPERVTLQGPGGGVDYSYEGTGTSWPSGPAPNHQHYLDGEPDPIYGAYWVLQLQDAAVCGNFIIHNEPGTVQTEDLRINFSEDTSNPYRNSYWVVVDSTVAESELREARVAAEPICINDVCEEFEPPPLAIEDQAAHWIDADTILWNRDLANVELHSSATGSLGVLGEEDADGTVRGVVTGGEQAATLTPTELSDAQRARVPQLEGYAAYATGLDAARVKELLRGQLWITGSDANGKQYGTQLQIDRAIDSLYASDADEATLGPVYGGGSITASVWAPTAQEVALRLYSERADGQLVFAGDTTMQRDDATGIWSLSGSQADWDRQYYRFVVTAYHPAEGQILVREARDPYSVSAYTNSLASQFVNVNDDDLKPPGWDAHAPPPAGAPEEAVIYEGHIRDFSARDASTDAAHRGKYLAFTAADSAPVRHLRSLAESGVTHFHVLPAFDIRSINEDPERQVNLDNAIHELCAIDDSNEELCPGDVFDRTQILEKLMGLDPTTDEARKVVDALKDIDGFNWGYDPVLFNVPEGSYATDPQGPARIREMRAMFQALHEMGLRVVMDVVYNHTAAEGADDDLSVFDRIVPGYYHRRHPITGDIERASCCSDTAAEKAMMAKFIKDSTVFWASHYKVGGFRFDWMSLHPVALMQETLAAVQAVDPDAYIYGEGWGPSSGSSTDSFEGAVQANMAGTGIGSFNDRMRDPIRNLHLSSAGDLSRIRAGLAGNLAEYPLVLDSGVTVEAASQGGYTADPQESVNYASVHDGLTLWDHFNQGGILPEGADTPTDSRVRMAVQAQSLVLLSQGVPFVHMGGDLLRSKSLTHNSYNSGDWFNHVDFTKQDNNWNVGLPLEGLPDDVVKEAIADGNAQPTAEQIGLTSTLFNEFLQIAASSPLFSLQSAADVVDRVGFHNLGKAAVPDLVVMSVDDGVGEVTNSDGVPRADLDPNADAVVVVFNGSTGAQSISVRTASGFALHAVQQASADAAVHGASFTEAEGGGTFSVPGLTTAVFAKAQGAAQGEGLSAFATAGFEPPVPYGDTEIHLRGQFNGWSTDAMNYVGGGVYEGFLELEAGTYAFKIASEDWSTVDIAAPDGQSVISLGEPATLSAAGQLPNLEITIPAAAEYRFALNALDSAAPVLTVTNAAAFPVQAFVRGNFNGWGTGNPLSYVGRGLYQTSIAVDAGTHGFKVASEDWSTVDLSVANESGAEVQVELNSATALSGPRNPNMLLNAPDGSDYLFTVNAGGFSATDDAQGGVTLWVALEEPFRGVPIYLRGGFNGWGTDNEMAFTGAAGYRADIDLEAGEYSFKVASEDWSTVNIGAGEASTLGEGVPLAVVDGPGTPNLSATIAEAGSYTFTLDLSRSGPELLLRKTSDVPAPPGGGGGEPPPEPSLSAPINFDAVDAAPAFVDDANLVSLLVADPLGGPGMAVSTTKNVGAAADAGTSLGLGGPVAFSEELNFLALDLYRESEGEFNVMITLVNSADETQSISATATYTESGAWQTLHFDFSMFEEGGGYDTLVVSFAPGAEGDGSTFFWDNIALVAAPPGATPPYGNTTVYLRGGFNDWGTGSPMTYLDNGIYQIDLALDLGDYEFKVASEDWAAVNLGAEHGSQVSLEAPVLVVEGGGNLMLGLAAGGNYRFALDANNTDRPALTVMDLGAAPYGHGEGTEIFVRGAFNDWGTANQFRYRGAGSYEAIVEVEAGEHQFKVASEDWATVNLGAASEAANAVVQGQEYAGFLSGSNTNLVGAFAEPGVYLFTLDASADSSAPKLWLAPLRPFGGTEVFLRGAMNEWGTADALVYSGSAAYRVDLNLEANSYEFKLASDDWATVNLGASDAAMTEVTVGSAYGGLTQGSNDNLRVNIVENGVYRFSVDGAKSVPPSLRVDKVADASE